MTRQSLPAHKCGKCPARWDGANFCHCPECHRTFTGITGFDLHRVGTLDDRRCDVNQRDKRRNLRLVESRPGIWGAPGHDSRFDGRREDGNGHA